MPDDEIVRLRAENLALHHERETLIALVKRASREVPGAFKRDLLDDLDTLLRESTVGRSRS